MSASTGLAYLLTLASEAYLVAGRIAEAMPLAERGLELSTQRGERGFRAWALRLLGEIAARRDPPRSTRPITRIARPWPSPRSSACALSSGIATWAWATCGVACTGRAIPATS